jgi:KDO2-lipid IV(A) lauroyltransferase
MRGSHIGVIVDQRLGEGVSLPFFGRPALSNPIVGLLARHFECPVHGARAVRLPGGRFFMEMSPPLDLPRDGKGRVDADATNRLVHGVVESWVREHPEQWLWLHDRWRM